jgi:hypothetical protein
MKTLQKTNVHLNNEIFFYLMMTYASINSNSPTTLNK